jgi:DNA-binding transcriptional regulator PaaX
MKKISQKKVSDAFYQLRKRGLIRFENKGGQIYIYLTEKGKKFAEILQIDELKIKNSKKWDKKWRILIFDIAQLKRIYREAFRGKLKELGFYQLQKSVLDSSLRLQSRS